MELMRLDGSEVAEQTVRALGLDPTVHTPFSPEAMAEHVRRAAGFACPCTRGALARAVTDVLTSLPGSPDELAELAEETVDRLLGIGDLLELDVSDDEQANTRRILLGPPSYVALTSGRTLLIGIDPNHAMTDQADVPIRRSGHIRYFDPPVQDSWLSTRSALSVANWLGVPAECSYDDLLADVAARLTGALSLTDTDGLMILDPATKPTYYRGRWRTLKPIDSGLFIVRRVRRFGAPQWSLIRAENGAVPGVVDLPLARSVRPAHDEAWRIQAAIDARNGTPQRFRVRVVQTGEARVSVFSPLPTWAQRFLEALGTPVPREKSLMSFALPSDDVEQVADFLERHLWMAMSVNESGD